MTVEEAVGRRVEVRVLGGFDVRVDGESVPDEKWQRRQAATLVKLLALAPSQRLHREQVIDALWSDLSVDEAAPRLHKAAHFARKVTGVADSVVLRDDTVALFPRAELAIDAVTFEHAAAKALASRSADDAATALDLYRGDLLPRDVYEPWTDAARERLRVTHIELLRVAGRWEDLLAIDPADENAHLAIMRGHAARGNRRAALRQFERLDHALARELGVRPGDEAVALRDELIDVRREGPPETLIGRRAELATIERLLDDVATGRGRTVLLVGPAGIGKSALLARTRDLADGRGWRTGHGVAAEIEGAWPFAPVLEAFTDISRRHPTLLDGLDDTYRAEIDRALRGDQPEWRRSSARQRLFVAAAELVRLAAAGTGLVLTFDDLHQADEASLRLVHYLARTMVDEPVAIVIGHRPSRDSNLDEVRSSLVNRHRAIELDLAPLEHDEIRAIVASHAPSAPETAVAQIQAMSGGVPFAAVELARGIASDLTSPQPIGAAMVAGLDRPTRDALQRVAVVGAAFDTDQFVALSGSPDDEAFGHLDAALAAGVVEPTEAGYRFRHGLVRDALLADLPAHRRRQVHRDAATRLQALDASPAMIGYHLLHAGDPKGAVPFVLRAAEIEAGLGAYRDALELLETVRTHATGPHRPQLLVLRGDLLMAVGDPAATVAYREALEAAPSRDHRMVRTRLARAATMSGDLDTVAAALDGLELDGGPSDADLLLARGYLAFFTGDLDTAWQISEEARRRVLQGNKTWQVFDLMALQGLLAHMRGEWFDRLRIELQRTRDSPEVATALFDAYLCPVEVLLYGRTPYAEVIELCTSLRTTANRAGALRAVAFATQVIGEAALLAGDLDLASRELQDAIDLHHEIAATGGEASALHRMAEVRLAQGDRAEANRLLQRALPLARWSTIAVHLIQRLYGTMVAAAGDVESARIVVDRAASTIGANDACRFCDIMFAVPAAIACADAGDLADARRYLRKAERSAGLWEGTSWQAALLETRAHLARAEGDGDAGTHLLEQAADMFDETGQPLDAARCRATARPRSYRA